MTNLRIERMSLDEWDAALPKTGFEVFHTAAFLDAIDQHFDGEMHLYGGFKGDHPVALMPAFVRKTPLGRMVVSPPPSMSIPFIGPIVMPNSPKQSAYESINKDFTEKIIDELDVRNTRTFVRLLCSPDYADPRPLEWSGLTLKPSFTYRINVTSLDDVNSGFSRSLRREIKQARDLDVTVSVEGIEGAHDVYNDVVSRYDEQDEPFTMPWEFVETVVENLGDRCRTYVARDPDGNYLSGIIVPFSNEAAYYWLGGARAVYENVSINNLLHWTILEDIATDEDLESVTKYDLVGANTERLCDYKSKFGGDLVPYYVAESAGTSMTIAKRTYQLLNSSKIPLPK
ncbi:GNAT family N-acetyltransferase [Haloferax namakaokahaiae]|uniref:GNAT family N-acetyltransferase n=1 Tax=Haloferax namakaokahaiae TaxID=1748331 RepID=A0ABD5ZJM0_9EURY